MTGDVVRVVIADDHPVFRDGLAGLVEAMPGMTVVGKASSGSEAVAAAAAQQPDVVVMDLHMPGMNGIEATSVITREQPGTAVLVLTMLEDDTSVFAALQADARGYLLKESTPEEIERAIRAVTAGDVLLDASVAGRVLQSIPATGRAGHPAPPFPQLTPREREILGLMAQGLSNPAIAAQMFLSEKTIRNYVSMIFAKIHVESRAAAVAAARDAGLGVAGPGH
jgi:DNA-binding NarL/FixJ family response regulator